MNPRLSTPKLPSWLLRITHIVARLPTNLVLAIMIPVMFFGAFLTGTPPLGVIAGLTVVSFVLGVFYIVQLRRYYRQSPGENRSALGWLIVLSLALIPCLTPLAILCAGFTVDNHEEAMSALMALIGGTAIAVLFSCIVGAIERSRQLEGEQ